ncbi:lisH domain-containing protein ARMC9 [Eurytemora carolleeae]|uniref:lisH domain-containing protein ARMC9 n=1 Tax=Eurytemora carolleeae TaxID=1294199 RepID=UPI000C773284|nr:lisH domain-containing protein ARMC9 [Eurytemora carolleeae]|eukprot:XP_023320211.1 lisH domain-containing protein ARMC9-like [Eurytemora affinis]
MLGGRGRSIREVCGESLLCRVVAVQCQELVGVQYSKLLRQYQQLRDDHTKLIGVTTELTAGLEDLARASLLNGHQSNIKYQWKNMIDRCNSVFPELFSGSNPSPPTWSQKRALRNLRIQEKVGTASSDERKNRIPEYTYSSILEIIDSESIREELQGHQTRAKLLLLQALRWMITKSEPEVRLEIVSTFHKTDFLGLGNNQCQERILSCFKPSEHLPTLMQQSLARIFNALASTGSGRSYIAGHPALLETLVSCLVKMSSRMETPIVEMIVATLQKLSLKFGVRKKLLKLGLVRWLGGVYLQDWKKQRQYSLEYSTALLMNLCLHRKGKEDCIPIAEELLNTLLNLASSPISQIKPYVNGTLYSLLSNSVIKDISRRTQVQEKLSSLVQRSELEVRQQLEYILEMVENSEDSDSDQEQESSEEDSGDGTDEDIEVEAEIEEKDPVISRRDELSGLALLASRFITAPVPVLTHEADERPIKPKIGGFEFDEECEIELGDDNTPKDTECSTIQSETVSSDNFQPSVSKPLRVKNEKTEAKNAIQPGFTNSIVEHKKKGEEENPNFLNDKKSKNSDTNYGLKNFKDAQQEHNKIYQVQIGYFQGSGIVNSHVASLETEKELKKIEPRTSERTKGLDINLKQINCEQNSDTVNVRIKAENLDLEHLRRSNVYTSELSESRSSDITTEENSSYEKTDFEGNIEKDEPSSGLITPDSLQSETTSPEPGAKPVVKSQNKPGPKPIVKSQYKLKSDSKPELKSRTEHKLKSEPDQEPEPEPEPKPALQLLNYSIDDTDSLEISEPRESFAIETDVEPSQNSTVSSRSAILEMVSVSDNSSIFSGISGTPHR